MADRAVIKNVMDKFVEGVEDLTSLEVQSYTGELSVVLSDDNSKFDWDGLLGKAKNGQIKLAIASKFDLDGDATLFRSSGPIPEGMEEAHADAVQAGQQVRSDMAEFFKGLITDLI